MKTRFVGPIAILIICVCALAAVVAGGQDKSKRPSPPAHAEYKFANGKMITMDYSSPRMNGRKVYGGLVPWGQIWRAGANEATTFVTTGDVMVGDAMVPAGSYTLFVIPTADSWTLIINKKTGEWGIPYPGEATELARTKMKVSSLSAPLENFTIGLDQNANGCTLRMDWETTRASVDIVSKSM